MFRPNTKWTDSIRPWIPPVFLDFYRARIAKTIQPAPKLRISAHDRQFTLPEQSLNELFPGIQNINLSFPASEISRQRDMVLPLAEILSLAAICQHIRPRRIFEIGTYTGSSTLIMAMNTSEETEIFTLDLKPEDVPFTIGSVFHGTDCASRIHQLTGDSRHFDYTPFLGKMDLILVDANHAYDFVEVDTQTAFQLMNPGGVIVWDDYRWLEQHPECVGVSRYLHEIQSEMPIRQLSGTRLAVLGST